MARQNARFGASPGTEAYERAYARRQFMQRVSGGIGIDGLPNIWGLDVLEIGCGHGGITCYLAAVGARTAVGIDLNERHIAYGRELLAELERATGRTLPARFELMNAAQLSFESDSFDMVMADNLFEHVDPFTTVLREIHRVLRPGGVLLVPAFSGIHSKYGLHLKHGLKLPWANLLFSESTIIDVMKKQAAERPELYDLYPGLRGAPREVRDLRRHRDLNGITHSEFLFEANRAGFDLVQFAPRGTVTGRLLFKIAPPLQKTKLGEVLSISATALLRKRKS